MRDSVSFCSSSTLRYNMAFECDSTQMCAKLFLLIYLLVYSTYYPMHSENKDQYSCIEFGNYWLAIRYNGVNLHVACVNEFLALGWWWWGFQTFGLFAIVMCNYYWHK